MTSKRAASKQAQHLTRQDVAQQVKCYATAGAKRPGSSAELTSLNLMW
jgi:hypothetical protein